MPGAARQRLRRRAALQPGQRVDPARRLRAGFGATSGKACRAARARTTHFLHSALLINRIIILTDLGRASEALPDVAQVLAMPTDGRWPRRQRPAFRDAGDRRALRPGDLVLGEQLVALAGASAGLGVPDELVERALAAALLAQLQGRGSDALAALEAVRALAGDDRAEGLSLRARCRFFQQASSLRAGAGDTAQALARPDELAGAAPAPGPASATAPTTSRPRCRPNCCA